MLDNVELIIYMKFQNILKTGCRDMDKKLEKSNEQALEIFQDGLTHCHTDKDLFG